MATGILCINTKTDLSMLESSRYIVIMRVIIGRITILSRLNPMLFKTFVYSLPKRKAPSMKRATAEVVLLSILREDDNGGGSDIPPRESRIPIRIEMIKGFLENLLITFFNPVQIVGSSSLESSRTVMEIATLIGEIEADDRVARSVPNSEGNANVMNGIPKKDKLPKALQRINKNK
jgi:hypothetical protein